MIWFVLTLYLGFRTHFHTYSVKLLLNVSYPPDYPDVYPEVSLEAHDEGDEDAELTPEEQNTLLSGLEEVVRSAEMPFRKPQSDY